MGNLSQKIKPEPLSSIYGKIDQVLVVFPSCSEDNQVALTRVLNKYRGLWKALDDRVKFNIYAFHETRGPQKATKKGSAQNDAFSRRELDHFIEYKEVEWELINPEASLEEPHRAPFPSQFVQDHFILTTKFPNETIIVEPKNHSDPRNRFVAEDLERQLQASRRDSELDFEGGNILFGDDYAVVGADTIWKNAEQPGGLKEAKEAFEKEFGLRRLIVNDLDPNPLTTKNSVLNWGDGRQALYHIDLYTTLGGRHPSRDEELIYIGNLVPFWDPENPKDLRSKVHFREEFELLRKRLDETAEFYEAYSNNHSLGPNFHVVRVPLIWEGRGGDRPVIRSYNNCLAERVGSQSTFYLPMYDDHERLIRNPRSHERRVRDIFSSYRSRVEWIEGDFNLLADQAASLHCIVKVLKRK